MGGRVCRRPIPLVIVALLVTGLSVVSGRGRTARASAPLAPTPPLYTVSKYMQTVDTTRLYDMGCSLGTAVGNGNRPSDAVVILDFGSPVVFGDGSFGASLFDGVNQKVGKIENAIVEFAHGYWVCSPWTSTLSLGMGTSNYGSDVTSAHGGAWARTVNNAHSEVDANGWGSQVSVVGGSDIELDWSSPSTASAWAGGYDSDNLYLYYDYGDAAGCPPASPSCGTSNHPEWNQHDVWYISWGIPPAWPLPEIYRTDGLNADQWHGVAYHGYSHDNSVPDMVGSLTQWTACGQRGCDPSVNNTPGVGWSQLWDALNNDPVTQQDLRWSTDIGWTDV